MATPTTHPTRFQHLLASARDASERGKGDTAHGNLPSTGAPHARFRGSSALSLASEFFMDNGAPLPTESFRCSLTAAV